MAKDIPSKVTGRQRRAHGAEDPGSNIPNPIALRMVPSISDLGPAVEP